MDTERGPWAVSSAHDFIRKGRERKGKERKGTSVEQRTWALQSSKLSWPQAPVWYFINNDTWRSRTDLSIWVTGSKPLMFQDSVSIAPQWASGHLNVTLLDWPSLTISTFSLPHPSCSLSLFLADLPILCNYFISYWFVGLLSCPLGVGSFSYWSPLPLSSEWHQAPRRSAVKMCRVSGCAVKHSCQLCGNVSREG